MHRCTSRSKRSTSTLASAHGARTRDRLRTPCIGIRRRRTPSPETPRCRTWLATSSGRIGGILRWFYSCSLSCRGHGSPSSHVRQTQAPISHSEPAKPGSPNRGRNHRDAASLPIAYRAVADGRAADLDPVRALARPTLAQRCRRRLHSTTGSIDHIFSCSSSRSRRRRISSCTKTSAAINASYIGSPSAAPGL